MRSRLHGLASALALGCFGLAGTRADWTEFRGPTGQGISTATHLPLEWSATRNVRWKKEIPGDGWSSPVTKGEKLFLTTCQTENNRLSLRVLALATPSGEILWNREIFVHDQPASIHRKNGNASPTPVIDGDRIYVHFGHLGTACLDLEGNVLWKKNEFHYVPVHGNGGSPIVAGEALIFSVDGLSDPFMAALRKSDGSVLWRTPRSVEVVKKFSFSTPLLVEGPGRQEVVCPASGALFAYDPRDGRELWKARYDGYSLIPRPVFGHGLLFVSSGYDHPIALAVRPGGNGDVTETRVAWKQQRGAPNTPSMLLVGPDLYMVSDAGIASCVDPLSGKIFWQERVGGDCSASPVFGDGKIYIQTEDGAGVVLKPGREFHLLARNEMGERTLASYAVEEGTLFIRGEKHLYCIRE